MGILETASTRAASDGLITRDDPESPAGAGD